MLVQIERVAKAAHRADQFLVAPLVDLAAQMTDIDIDDIGQAFEGLIPYLFDDHAARQGPARMQEKIFQQGVFLGAEFDALALAPDLARQPVDLDVGGRARSGARASASNSAPRNTPCWNI